jgi:uncharacterized membrane protein YgcG
MSSLSNENTLHLTVDNIGFLLDRLGEDCHPLQFLRELTQNSIEAIQRSPERTGEIIWDVDWTSYELGDHPVFKLCVTDTGCGMTGDEMLKYINQLSSSISTQSREGNYGVGAKIAAATRNHAGLIYLSWREGVGAMIHLWRNPVTGQYGLRQIERPDGTFGHWATLDDDVKPGIIGDHGTRVILYGNSQDADTMAAPPGAASPSTWIAKYLNGRYFQFPEGVVIKARQGWEHPRANTDVNILRTVTGQEAYLSQHREASGVLELTGARVHWWILKDEKALSSNSGFVESSGHIAALHGNEIYELASGRAGHAKLQQFGIIFGYRQVVLYVEPNCSEKERITTNTARTQLLRNNEPLPWSDWATEFRLNMPAEIDDLMQRIASKSTSDNHGKSIRDRLKSLMDLYKVSRYKPQSGGPVRIAEPMPEAGGSRGRTDGGQGGGGGGGRSQSGGGAVGGVYSVFLKKDGEQGRATRPDVFPQVQWISVDDGTRDAGDIEDKAARYLADQNVLLINADFRVFIDMIQHWVQSYSREHGDVAGLREVVRDSVHDWFEQALVETIIGLQALKGSREWSEQDLRDAWAEPALTSVVMQRYHPYNCIKRELGTRLGALRR